MPTQRKSVVPTVDLGNGTVLPAEIEFPVHGEDFTVTISAAYRPDSGRYHVRRVSVEANGDSEITGEVLRNVRVADHLAVRLRHLADDAASAAKGPVATVDGEEVFRTIGDLDGTLKHVARWYRWAVALELPPTQTVAEKLGVPKSTASLWVTRARDRGLLTVTDRRAPGKRGRR